MTIMITATRPGTIMSRLFHARKNMQRQLADLYQGPPPDADGAAPDPEDSPGD